MDEVIQGIISVISVAVEWKAFVFKTKTLLYTISKNVFSEWLLMQQDSVDVEYRNAGLKIQLWESNALTEYTECKIFFSLL